jgi:hypothetical protein
VEDDACLCKVDAHHLAGIQVVLQQRISRTC